MRKRIAVIDRQKCHPQECGNYLCAKLCPVNRSGADCIYPGDDTGKKARIDEMLCTGCGICPQRCPFGAITIINLPEQLTSPPVHRYGENMFELYSLPTPVFGQVTGIVGKNGLGKSTALKILADVVKPNLGKWQNPPEFKEVLQYFKGTEMQRFLERLRGGNLPFSYKPQQVDLIPQQFSGTVQELLQRMDKNHRLPHVIEQLQLASFLDHEISTLSGGELQRVAIAATVLKPAHLYLLDEPTSYLDIKQRIHMAHFVSTLPTPETAVLVIEHDLVILDALADALNILYGHEGVYGAVSGLKSTREGINAFLEGYLKEENMRFRNHPLQFEKSQERVTGRHPLLSWSGLRKKVGSFSFVAEQGTLFRNEIVGIVGENGIGKTTFMKLLAGILETDAGSVDRSVKVSYKPQYLETQADQTVLEFLQEAVTHYPRQLIQPLDLEPLFSQSLKSLSGGQLQRVAIAQCLSRNAELFLLDEPSAYLDVEQRLLLSKIIKNVASEREVTILVIDHDVMFLDYLSDRLIVVSGQPARQGVLEGPFALEEGMNRFLQSLNITLRRDIHSHRPRINQPGSVKDREQRAAGKWYGD